MSNKRIAPADNKFFTFSTIYLPAPDNTLFEEIWTSETGYFCEKSKKIKKCDPLQDSELDSDDSLSSIESVEEKKDEGIFSRWASLFCCARTR